MVKTRCSGVGPTCFLHIGIWVDMVVALGFGLNIVRSIILIIFRVSLVSVFLCLVGGVCLFLVIHRVMCVHFVKCTGYKKKT